MIHKTSLNCVVRVPTFSRGSRAVRSRWPVFSAIVTKGEELDRRQGTNGAIANPEKRNAAARLERKACMRMKRIGC